MKILHTSDWHIGRTLYGRKRHDEFEAFSSWLIDTLRERDVDVLLVAGDIFDNGTPGNRSQEQYYTLISQAALLCRHVVVTAGNHDSPSFLSAAKGLLKSLNIHVIGSITDAPGDEVLVLNDRDGIPGLIVCAVPYVRDRDIRTAEVGESYTDKERKLLEGTEAHYAAVTAVAEQCRAEFGRDIPLVVMGHLFAAGGETSFGDGVRDLYVGSLVYVPSSVFGKSFDYVALGHLHAPQVVGGSEVVRYSGSPLPMSFGEARQQKSVCLVDFNGRDAAGELVPIPRFQELEQISGDMGSISKRLAELSQCASTSWLEVIYDGDEVVSDLRERLEEMLVGTEMELLRIKNCRTTEQRLERVDSEELLEELDVNEVFERCLELNAIPTEQADELKMAYRELLAAYLSDRPESS